jgi:class 3 adenylate cyclase
VDILKMISKGEFFLAPGESRTFDLTATPGALFGFDMVLGAGFMVPIQEGTSASRQDLKIDVTDSGHQPSAATLSAGPVHVQFQNKTTSRVAVMFNIMPPGEKADLWFDPFLTGKSLFNNQAFRQLYPSATLGEKGGIGVKDLTLLFTDLKGSTAMYDRIGDLKAFSLVQQHFERLTKAIQANGGAVVKTIGDAVMASFDKPSSAVKASAEMLKEIEEFNKEHGSTEIILKIGIHRGASIAVTLNDRLDYFGQTVNIAARVQGLAGAEEIYLTKNVYLSPGVKELLEDFYVKAETASLKGVQKAMQVYKVTYEPPAKVVTKKVTKKKSKKRKATKKKAKGRRSRTRR